MSRPTHIDAWASTEIRNLRTELAVVGANLADVLAELDAANAYIDDLEHQIRDLQRSDTLDRAMPT